MKKKILVFGASGTLGSNLIHYLKKYHKFIFSVNESKIFFNGVDYCKFSLKEKMSEDDIKKKIKNLNPDLIINCAAITDLDLCEKLPKRTKFINEIFPEILAKICKKFSISFFHISTDHLYNGKDKIKKNETFKTKPLNFYSKQKLNAEKNILKINKKTLIIRTNFFGHSPKKNQFLDYIIKTAQDKKKVYLYDDYYFTPISTEYLSKIINILIKKKSKGIFNIVSNESISKYEFGLRLFDIQKLDRRLIVKSKMKSKNLIAKRCKNLSLSNEKLKKKFKIKIPSLDLQLKKYLKEKKYLEKKLFTKIPYGRHSINKDDLKKVTNIIKSGSLTQGHFIKETEEKIANYVGSKYAVLVSSATAGLHITYKALGLNKNKLLITSPITFVSTANAALYCKSNILFNDIDIDTVSISPRFLKKSITNKRAHIISPVHMGGLASNMREIYNLSSDHGAKIVEDASHALGASYDCGAKVGSCKYSDASIFSFHPVKIIASGEGGAVTTNNRSLYEKLTSLRSHGIVSEGSMLNKKFAYSNNQKNLWYYEMQDLGFHYRQTEIHAALLNSQLDRIQNFLDKRRKLAKRYDSLFSNIKNILPLQKEYRNMSSNHLYILKIDFKKLKISRNEFMFRLRKKNIITQVHYIPLPIHPYYKGIGFKMKNLNNSNKYYEECLSIPLYYDLSFKQQDYVVESIFEILN